MHILLTLILWFLPQTPFPYVQAILNEECINGQCKKVKNYFSCNTTKLYLRQDILQTKDDNYGTIELDVRVFKIVNSTPEINQYVTNYTHHESFNIHVMASNSSFNALIIINSKQIIFNIEPYDKNHKPFIIIFKGNKGAGKIIYRAD